MHSTLLASYFIFQSAFSNLVCRFVLERVNFASYGHKFEKKTFFRNFKARDSLLVHRLSIQPFSLMKSHCSHFCLTKFYQLAKTMKEMLSTKPDTNFTAQKMPRDTVRFGYKQVRKSQVHYLKIKGTQPNKGEKRTVFIERFHMTSQQQY